MFADKFVIKNLEQHVTVSYANVIAVRDSNYEFEANEILISVSHGMFHVIVSCKLKECGESTYFEAGPRCTTSTTSNVSEHYSDIDTIAEDTDSNIPRAVKRPRRLTSRPLNQSSGLSTINDVSVVPFQDPGLSINNGTNTVQIQKLKINYQI
ncbi:hypothetical protein C2G38_2180103 [Gigaspora rosea]|uniref:Uncharacterized protein n=1 Tax=Gigaspora rosea TaxID=44941 RepID=A0A397VDQ1_9GLOM|nr:hypothetical protein C2G38_2180103 [Gigaspora rosea]